MAGKVTDPKVTLTLDSTKFVAGTEKAALAWDQMSLSQKRTAQAMQRQLAMQAGALREDASRQAALAAATERAEARKRAAMQSTGKVALGAGAAMVAGLALSAHAAMAWQSDFAGVAKTLSGSGADLGVLERQLRGLALVLPASHDEIAAVAQAAGQLGIAPQSIAAFTHVMIDLGNTTTMSADEAATALAQLMNIMQTAPDQVSNLGSSVLALGNAGAATEQTIVDMAQRIAGAGKTVGMSTADVLGLAGAISSVGVDAEAGGSSVSRIIINIAQSVAKGGDKLQSWAKVAGMSAQQFAAAWKNAPAQALASVIAGLGRMQKSGEDVFAVLADVDATNIRTTQTLLNAASAGDLLTKQIDLSSKAWTDNTALAKAAAARYDTVAAKTQLAKNAINDAGISIGTNLLPVLGKAATGVADFAKWIGSLPEGTLQAATTFGALAAGVLLAGGAVMTGLPKWQKFRTELNLLSTTAPRASAALGALGSALATIAVVGVVEQVNNSFIKSNDEMAASVEETSRVLQKAKTGTDLDSLFTINGQKDGARGAIDQINGLDDAIRRLVHPNTLDNITEFQSSVGRFFGGKDQSPKNFAANEFKQIGQSLASLIQDGHADEAGREFGILADRWRAAGGNLDDLRKLMPDYGNALAAADAQQKAAAASAENLTTHYNAATGAVEQLTDADKQYRDSVAQSDAEFINLGDAYSASVSDAQAAAQAKADAYNKEASDREDASHKRGISLTVEKKQWQDFYDGKTVTIQAYLDKLQQQVTTQQQWETDLLTLAGRGVDKDALDMLRGGGKDLAPMIHDLATKGTADQLSKLNTLSAQGAPSATQQFADELVSGSDVLAAAGAQLGDAAVSALVTKLLAGKMTLQQIVNDYGLIVAGMPTRDQWKAGMVNQWKPTQASGFGGFGGSFDDLTTPSNQALMGSGGAGTLARSWTPNRAPGTPLNPLGSGLNVQIIPVPVPVQTTTDQSQNFWGPTTFADPASASSKGAAARANTAGRRGGPVKVS